MSEHFFKKYHIPLIFLCIVLGTILRLIQLPYSSLWFDEATSYYIAKMSSWGIFETLYNDVSEPFYYFLLKFWMAIVGENDIMLALLSVIFSITSIYIVYLLALEIFGSYRIAIVASLLSAFSRESIFQSPTVRFYPLLELLSPLCYLLYWKVIHKKMHWLPYALCAFIGVMTHSYFWLILFSQIVATCILCGPRKMSEVLWKPALTTLVLFIPWGIVFIHQVTNNLFGGLPPLDGIPDAIDTLNQTIFLKLNLPNRFKNIQYLFTIPFIGCVLYKSLSDLRIRALTICYLILVGIPIVVSLYKPVFMPGRYDIIAICMIAILAAKVLWWLIDTIKFKKSAYAILSLYLIISLTASFRLIQWRMQVGNDKRVAYQLAPELQKDDIVLFTTLSYLAPKYYLEQLNVKYQEGYVFPKEFQHLPGHIDYRVFDQKPAEETREEAIALTEKLDKRNFRHLVVFTTEKENEFGRLLKPLRKVLDEKYELIDERDVGTYGEPQTSFYNRILIYKKK